MNGNISGVAVAGRGISGFLGDRIRPTIGVKLGLFFVVFFAITYGNIHVAATQFDSLGSSARIVNDTGRLRYLSQRIAYLATRLDAGDRQALKGQIDEYTLVLANIDRQLQDEGRALLDHDPTLQDKLRHLRTQWRNYAGAVSTIITSDLADSQARRALAYLHGTADDMLATADGIVNALTETDRQVRRQIHRQLDGGLVLEGIFLLLVFLFIQRGVSRPIRHLVRLCQSFASGQHAVRMSFFSRDEVGDLARSFNHTADITAALIRDLNERTREARLLHQVAMILQESTSLAEAIGRIAKILPDGWQYSEVAAAYISCGDAASQSRDFRPTPWCQRAELATAAGVPIQVQICYREARPVAAEGPFLAEERQMLDDVARMLKSFIDKVDAQHVQSRLLSILESTTDLVTTFYPDGRIFYLNQAALRLFSVAPTEDAGAIADHYPPWVVTQQARVALPFAAAHGAWSGEIAVVDKSGREIPMLQTLIAHRDARGEVGYFSVIARDIGERIAMEERLTRSRDFYLGLFHDFPDLIWRTGVDGRTDYFNHTWIEFTGRPIEQLHAEGWLDSLHPDDRDKFTAALRHTLASGEQFEVEYRLRHADGSYRWMLGHGRPYHDLEGAFAGIIGASSDITERKRIDEELEQLASYDSLTGLPNRNLLNDRIAQALAFARRWRRQAAVMFLDLDRFKTVNDTLGHDVGDQLLVVVAQRLRACLREGDTLARIGGDEFIVVLPDVGGEGDVGGVADKLIDSLALPFDLGGHELFVSGSLGISLYPRDGEDIATLLKHADIAMYRAKDEGRDNRQYYAAEMNVRALERLSLENSLRHALERDEFVLYYQPQVDFVSGKIVGLEALVRWRHPELGIVPPAQFIPLAEETGLIVPIGEWVLRTACAQNRAWQAAGLPAVRVAVNLSARQFRRHDVVKLVADALAASGLEGRYLDLELTESMLMHDPEQVIATLTQLKAMDVRIALDDFGTGYSSLAYLKRFPIDEIKIDRSFVCDLDQNSADAPIVLAIIGIARGLGLGIVAEGVETPGQHNYLWQQRCDRMQGYLFSRPVPADDIASLLAVDTRFEIAVPLPAASSLPDHIEGENPAILVVDDNPKNIDVLKGVLRDGYSVRAALNGVTALKIVRGGLPPALILLDIMMPDMDGFDVMIELQVNPATRDIPVILMTALADAESEIKGLQAGAADYITKPFNPSVVRARVATHLALRQAERLLAIRNKELQRVHMLAENIVSRMCASTLFDERHLRYLVVPVERSNGDILLSAFTPDGRQWVLVGDFVGHGLPAAVAAPLAAHVFYSGAAAGGEVEDTIAAINDILCRQLPTEMFLAGSMVEISRKRDEFRRWSAAMPEHVILDTHGATRKIAPSTGILPFGIEPVIDFRGSHDRLSVSRGDRLYILSDGITETANPFGELFGIDRLEKFLATQDRSAPLDRLMPLLKAFHGADTFDDDITLVEIEF